MTIPRSSLTNAISALETVAIECVCVCVAPSVQYFCDTSIEPNYEIIRMLKRPLSAKQ